MQAIQVLPGSAGRKRPAGAVWRRRAPARCESGCEPVVSQVSPGLPLVGRVWRPREGWRVKVSYEGHLNTMQGPPFDTGEIRFTCGSREVIPGLDRGVARMGLGETVDVTFGPELGYGSVGFGDAVPPDTPLAFRVTLLTAWPVPSIARRLGDLLSSLASGV